MDIEIYKTFDFIKKFVERSSKIAVPYHINVIDELHANENAHSRILTRLLLYKTENKHFEVLESFIAYLVEMKRESEQFSNIKIENPEITQETERIDLWIRDKTYAIIIENKIHYAADQEQQIERYIGTTKRNGFKEEQIFIIYLSPRGEEVSEQSLGKYIGKFNDRYLNLSYKDGILPWLKEKLLPNVRLKDILLRSAIEQYIDHLEGLFDMRTINNKTNMELQELIKKELGLNNNPQENIAKLRAKQEEINFLNNQIDLLKQDNEKEIFQNWQNSISEKYHGYESMYEEKTRVGFIIPLNNGSTSVRVYISYDNQLYCQIDMLERFDGQDPPEEVKELKEKMKYLLPRRSKDNQIWKYFPRDDYDGVFNRLQEVLSILTAK
jgi:hypothetical protein